MTPEEFTDWINKEIKETKKIAENKSLPNDARSSNLANSQHCTMY